jgi:hypothetical protein
MQQRRMARGALGAAVLAAALIMVTGWAQATPTAARPAAIGASASGELVAGPSRTFAASAAATGRRGAVYGGHTLGESQYPIAMWLSADRAAVTRVVTAFHAPCSTGLAFNLVDNGAGAVPIAPDGSFNISRPGTFDLASGMTAATAVTVAGKVRGRRLSGTASLHVDEKDPSGATVATCDSSVPIRGRSAPGRVYAGATSQNGPVVLELPASHRKVRHLRIGWQSTCRTGTEFQVADDQVDFAIKRRRFGDAYKAPPYNIEGGGHGRDHYAVRGKVLRRKASGTFRVRTSEVDANGQPTDACDSGTLTYKARTG